MTLNLSAYLNGRVVPLEAVPDPTFAGRLVGDGIAIDPTDIACVLRAPCAARVLQVHRARHACTLETESGVRMLLHVGLETVLLDGAGFVTRVAAGDFVVAGQALIEFDRDVLKRYGKNPITVLAIENSDEHLVVWRAAEGLVVAGAELLRLLEHLSCEYVSTQALV